MVSAGSLHAEIGRNPKRVWPVSGAVGHIDLKSQRNPPDHGCFWDLDSSGGNGTPNDRVGAMVCGR